MICQSLEELPLCYIPSPPLLNLHYSSSRHFLIHNNHARFWNAMSFLRQQNHAFDPCMNGFAWVNSLPPFDTQFTFIPGLSTLFTCLFWCPRIWIKYPANLFILLSWHIFEASELVFEISAVIQVVMNRGGSGLRDPIFPKSILCKVFPINCPSCLSVLGQQQKVEQTGKYVSMFSFGRSRELGWKGVAKWKS